MTDVQRLTAVPLSERLNRLTTLPREQLVNLWTKHFGKGPPKAISTSLLLRAMSYSLQERSLGGLKTKDQKLLAKLGGVAQDPLYMHDATVIGSAPTTGKVNIDVHKIDTQHDHVHKKTPKTTPRPAPRYGTRLVRTWQGNSHIVDVSKDGYTWNGKVYASLTKVAFAITGARWSGPRFFRT